MNDHIIQILDDYLDRSLPVSEQTRAEEHLQTCDSCREELRLRQDLLAQAGSLPKSLKPQRDLWPGIESRLSPGPHAIRGDRSGAALLPKTGFARWWRTSAAAAAMIAFAAAGYWWLQPSDGWNFAVLQGTAVLGSDEISGRERIEIGDVLRTGENGKARIQVGIIGHVEVEPNTSIRLLGASLSDHRLALDEGTITATIFAPPRLFFVETPFAVAVDLGCTYTLTVDDDGGGVLTVSSGWVALEYQHRESIVPAGAVCKTRPGFGPGTPYQTDASDALVDALTRYDFGLSDDVNLRIVLAESRNLDSITLWHLYLRTLGEQRAGVYDRLSRLVPPPKGVTRDGMLAGDPNMIKLWRKYLNLGMDSWWKIM